MIRHAFAVTALAAFLLLAPVATGETKAAPAVPILMYHVIADPAPGAPYPDLYVSPSAFRGQIAWLAKHGYHAVTMKRVYDAWQGRGRLPAHPVVLTFDDGYLPDYTVAMPVLKARGWPGVLNLAVAHQWHDLPSRHIWKLLDAGWELADHTFTHPDLTGLGADQLRHEIAESRRFLQRQYHKPVEFFCYPAGRYDDAVVAAVRAAGFLGATTTNYGLARPSQGLLTLSRVRVNRSDGVAGLAGKLRALGV